MLYYPSVYDYDDIYYRIPNVSSGKYTIRITTHGYFVYEETIHLQKINASIDNENGTYNWKFTAYLFEDFYDNAVYFDIYLEDTENLI